MTGCTLDVLSAGMSWIQDLGRCAARDGLATNGALDQYSAKMANALVGNPTSAPLIESLVTGIRIRLSQESLVAVCGAAAAVFINDVPVLPWQPTVVPGGSRVRVATAEQGIRTYLAVRGTWQVHRWAHSVAPDHLLGLGTILSAGDQVMISQDAESLQNPALGVGLFRPDARPRMVAAGPLSVDLMPGPDLEGFAGIRSAIEREVLTVDPRSDHVGVRLRTDFDVLGDVDEVLSHGVPVGAVEITPERELIVLLRGRSLTAGYPVVGFVSTTSLDCLGQMRPGDQVRFRWRTREHCVSEARRAAREIRRVGESMARAIGSIPRMCKQVS